MVAYKFGVDGEHIIDLTEEEAEGFNNVMVGYRNGTVEVIDLRDNLDSYPVIVGAADKDIEYFEKVAPLVWEALMKDSGE